jgi:hypothetical protein
LGHEGPKLRPFEVHQGHETAAGPGLIWARVNTDGTAEMQGCAPGVVPGNLRSRIRDQYGYRPWVLDHWVLDHWVLDHWVLDHWVLDHWVWVLSDYGLSRDSSSDALQWLDFTRRGMVTGYLQALQPASKVLRGEGESGTRPKRWEY